MTSELTEQIDLSSFGYADGGYMSKCSHCKETFIGAKRAWSCKPCAIIKSSEPKITRAAPDVPELVRYRPAVYMEPCLGGMLNDEFGEYVLHSQAVEIIAAERSEKHRAQEAVLKLERELAQYEAQEPVAWRHPEAGWTDVSKAEVAVHCKHGTQPQPLYASPAPAADLKAESSHD